MISFDQQTQNLFNDVDDFIEQLNYITFNIKAVNSNGDQIINCTIPLDKAINVKLTQSFVLEIKEGITIYNRPDKVKHYKIYGTFVFNFNDKTISDIIIKNIIDLNTFENGLYLFTNIIYDYINESKNNFGYPLKCSMLKQIDDAMTNCSS